jgi:hypothetical protein
MLERAQVKTLPVLNRAVDLAPGAQACCGVCRTCATTNIFALAGSAFLAAWSFVAKRRA